MTSRTKPNCLRRAREVSTFSFPKDHGQHPDFRTEWWYLCGRLGSNDGSQWAYHFTIFRRALEKWTDLALVALAIGSGAIRRIPAFRRVLAKMLEGQNSRRIGIDGYVAHLSITNLQKSTFVFFERGGTSLFGVAGARTDSLGVWLKDWRLEQAKQGINVIAERHGFSINLDLSPRKPPVLHGQQGLTLKGPEPGQASYHYSLSSLSTIGTLTWDGTPHSVFGPSWIDREYGTAMMPHSVRGWEWFGLVMDNHHEIMLSLIRNTDGALASASAATIVFADGTWHCLTRDDLWVEATEMWISPTTGAHYPTWWHVRIEGIDTQLYVQALIKEHEIVSSTSTTIDYWEGPVSVSGKLLGQSIRGTGHVELVGYSQPVGGRF